MDNKNGIEHGATLEEKIKTWKESYREVIELTDEESAEKFIFKRPGHAELSRFTQAAMKDGLKGMRTLTKDCLLHPAPEVLDKIAVDRPGIWIALGNEIQKLAGTSADFFVRKL